MNKIWEAYSQTLSNQRTKKTFTTEFGRIPADLINKRPYVLTLKEIETLDKAMIAKGLTPQSRRHTLSLIGRLSRWSVKQKLCEPLTFEIPLPSVDNKKTEFLNDEQLSMLLKALDEDFDQASASAVKVVIFSGVRRSALFSLKWEDIDFERGFITLRGEFAKSGRTSSIPMAESVRAILENHPRLPDCPYIFPTLDGKKRSGLPKDFIRRVREKAKLPEDFRFLHGLRHSFASRLASSGQVDLYTLQHLLTHESPEMTQRYSHLMDDALRRAARLVDAVMLPQKPE